MDLKQKRLLLDGREFPWEISDIGPTITSFATGKPRVIHIPLLTDDMQIVPAGAPDPAPTNG
ncbi:hypothetical protein D5S18_03045 [Nocardia panacis]|uniref:Uncharacterized protein n=1 Tax=Nocardia panacis TaxID=2340916 RepID=A0A3A4KPC9_9NOCA|nr:hypothetical protein [Nocardia panacis]RJO79322.1 hypothetical protein D5S18_03045 [Nocardia panacis]